MSLEIKENLATMVRMVSRDLLASRELRVSREIKENLEFQEERVNRTMVQTLSQLKATRDKKEKLLREKPDPKGSREHRVFQTL